MSHIEAARADLRGDLEALGYPIHNGPLDKTPMVHPCIVIVPPRTGPWVGPGKTFATMRFNFDLIFQTTGDDTEKCRLEIEKFVIDVMTLNSTWVRGLTVDSPYMVQNGPNMFYEILVHVQDEREG